MNPRHFAIGVMLVVCFVMLALATISTYSSKPFIKDPGTLAIAAGVGSLGAVILGIFSEILARQ